MPKDTTFLQAFQKRIMLVKYPDLGFDEQVLYKLIKEGAVTAYYDSDQLKPLEFDTNIQISGAAYVTDTMCHFINEFGIEHLLDTMKYTSNIQLDPPSCYSNVRVIRWSGKSEQVYDILKRLTLHLRARSDAFFQHFSPIPAQIGELFQNLYAAVDDLPLKEQTSRCGKIIPVHDVPIGIDSYFVCVAEGHVSRTCEEVAPLTSSYRRFTFKKRDESLPNRPFATRELQSRWYSDDDLAEIQKQNELLQNENAQLEIDIQMRKERARANGLAVVKMANDPKIDKYIRRASKKAASLCKVVTRLVKQSSSNYANMLGTGIGEDLPLVQQNRDESETAAAPSNPSRKNSAPRETKQDEAVRASPHEPTVSNESARMLSNVPVGRSATTPDRGCRRTQKLSRTEKPCPPLYGKKCNKGPPKTPKRKKGKKRKKETDPSVYYPWKSTRKDDSQRPQGPPAQKK